MHRSFLGTIALLTSAAAVSPASAQTVYGLSGSDRIVTFDAATPGTLTSNRNITGLVGGEVLTGIDFRPSDRQLYALGTSGNLYRLTLSGGSYAATTLGVIGTAPAGSNFGIDFNPTVDRLRFISDTGQNLRINPTVAPPGVIVDGSINPAGFNIIGSGYINSTGFFFGKGPTATSLYGIDAAGLLLRTGLPNAGTYFSIGTLGLGSLGADARVGFDIAAAADNRALLAFNDSFYTVNLGTGAATLVGGIGFQNIRGISAAIPEPATWAMMIGGLGLVGAAVRRRPKAALATA